MQNTCKTRGARHNHSLSSGVERMTQRLGGTSEGGTRVLVSRCTNMGSKALHVSLDCATSRQRLPSPTLSVTTAWIGASHRRWSPQLGVMNAGSDMRHFTPRSLWRYRASRQCKAADNHSPGSRSRAMRPPNRHHNVATTWSQRGTPERSHRDSQTPGLRLHGATREGPAW